MMRTSQSSYFLDYGIPVIVLDYAPLLLLAFLTAQTRVNLLSRERNEFGLDPVTVAAFENDIDQICGISILTHASRYPKHFHMLSYTCGLMIVVMTGSSWSLRNAERISCEGFPCRYKRCDMQEQSLQPNFGIPCLFSS